MQIKLKNNKILKYRPINVSDIEIPNTGFLLEETYVDNKLQSIIFDNDLKISLGDKLHFNLETNDMNDYTSYYKVNIISKYIDKYIVNEFIKMESNQFLIPSIININHKVFLNNFLINCYTNIDHKDWKDKKNVLHIVCRFTPSNLFNSIDSGLVSQPNFVSKIKDDRFNIYTFEIHDRYKKDVDLYLNNKVNDLSKEYCSRILMLNNCKRGSKLHKLLTDEEGLRADMSIDLGYNIPENIPLNLKPDLNKLLWKMNQN